MELQKRNQRVVQSVVESVAQNIAQGVPSNSDIDALIGNLPSTAPQICFTAHLSRSAQETIYLDYAAATPVLPEAEALASAFGQKFFGNPASQLHPMGVFANYALEQSRVSLAHTLAITPEEIIFTSSATEANNLILRGMWNFAKRKRNKILVCATEHSAVAQTARELSQQTYTPCKLQVIPVDKNGVVDLAAFGEMADNDTLIACVMDVNNETGVVQSALPEIYKICQKLGIHLHVDAVQGFARGVFPNSEVQYHSATVSSAKIYGPKGAAALVLRRKGNNSRLAPQLTGGGHEQGLRAGTPNLPAIVGFAAAAAVVHSNLQSIDKHCRHLEDVFMSTLLKSLEGKIELNLHGKGAKRASGLLSFSFANTNAMRVVELAEGVSVSVGSACKTLQATASSVLMAMGVPLEEALSSIRVSFGIPTTVEQATRAAEILAQAALTTRLEQPPL